MRKKGYLVVEGPHDVEFACRLIRSRNRQLNRVTKLAELDSELSKLVPDKFPHGGDLQRRVPVPLFLQSDTLAIAIQSAGGDSRIAQSLEETFAVYPSSDFFAVGVILDSDSQNTPSSRRDEALNGLSLRFPERLGDVANGAPRTGVFVLPDNANQGTLETLLLQCGHVVYPEQLASAERFVNEIFPSCCEPGFKEIHAPAGKNKAIVGSVGQLLRPGKAIQTSIQDNEWLKGAGLEIDAVKSVANFLDKLFLLSPS